MTVLGISGSPKRGGFTDLLLDKALEGAEAGEAMVEKVVLNDLVFRPCQECGGCDETGICVQDDDLKPFYQKLLKADAVIVASPIYFTNITAQLKAMIDRCQALWVKKYVLKQGREGLQKRPGAFLCIGGKEKKEYFESARQVIKAFFATLDIEYKLELFLGGINELPADSPKRKEALRESFQIGLSLIKR